MYWGTSEWSAQEIMEAHVFAKKNHLIGPSMEQPQYNMLVRDKVEVEYEQIYKGAGLGTTIWSPLASGVLTGKYNKKSNPKNTRLEMAGLEWLKERMVIKENLKRVDRLQKIANDIGLSMPVMAIAWCLKNDRVSTVILGASKLTQLKENFKAIEAKEKLTPEIMQKIEKALDNTPIRPAF